MLLEVEESDIRGIINYLLRNKPSDLFLLDIAKYVVGKRRFDKAKSHDKIDVSSSIEFVRNGAIEHNYSGMQRFSSIERTNRLIRPLCAIDKVFFKAHEMSVLSIGPRTEMELLSLVAQGFDPDKIRGLDLISYSPWIDLGNMHYMPYKDNTFDVVISGWVLGYSDNPELACQEMLRVSKDDCIIAIGSTYVPEEQLPDQVPDVMRRKENKDEFLPKVDDLLSIFGDAVKNVYVRHDPESDDAIGRTIVIFDVCKGEI